MGASTLIMFGALVAQLAWALPAAPGYVTTFLPADKGLCPRFCHQCGGGDSHGYKGDDKGDDSHGYKGDDSEECLYCSDECPEICVTNRDPVCAVCEGGSQQTFPNCCMWRRAVCRFGRGSPRSSGCKLDPDSGSGRGSSRRSGGRTGGRSGRGSPLASSSHHSQYTASASSGSAAASASAAVHSAVDAAALADKLSPRATASAAAAVYLPPTDHASRPHQTRARMHWARMKNTIDAIVQFMQKIVNNARDPVAVGDALLWLVLLPLEAMRRTARNPGAMALLRVTLEATAELLVAAMLAGAAICVTALQVITEPEEGADGDSDKQSEPVHRLLPCCQSLPHEPPLPVDAGGERCSPRPALSAPLPTSLH